MTESTPDLASLSPHLVVAPSAAFTTPTFRSPANPILQFTHERGMSPACYGPLFNIFPRLPWELMLDTITIMCDALYEDSNPKNEGTYSNAIYRVAILCKTTYKHVDALTRRHLAEAEVAQKQATDHFESTEYEEKYEGAISAMLQQTSADEGFKAVEERSRLYEECEKLLGLILEIISARKRAGMQETENSRALA